MKVIGMIGMIGSGKSTICQQIDEFCRASSEGMRVCTIDLDIVSKDLFRTNEFLRKELVTAFGAIMIDPDFEAKRKYVIEQIMGNDVLYKRLNDILISYIRPHLANKLVQLKEIGFDLVLVEGVILGYYPKILNEFDCVIDVFVSDDEGRRRVKLRKAYYTDRQIDILQKRSLPADDLFESLDVELYPIDTNLSSHYINATIKSIIEQELNLPIEQPNVDGAKRNHCGQWVHHDSPHPNFQSPGVSTKTEPTEYYPKKKEKVAVYAGSFAPFHIGHFAIVEDLLEIFDSVVLLQCINGGKHDTGEYRIDESKLPKNCQLIEWDYAFVDFLDVNVGDEVELVIARGIRNGTDLDYETSYIKHLTEQCNFHMKELPPVIYIPCRDEYKHISSSSIRAILPFDEVYAKSLMV